MAIRTILGLARACHPAPCVAVTAFAGAMALAAGHGTASVRVAAAVLAGQLSVGWSNDWLDAARDRAAARHDKPIVDGAVGASTVRVAAVTALAVCVPLSVFAGGWGGAAVHLLAVASAWSYNVGLKATLASPLPYALSFGLLPVFVALCVGGRAPAWTVAAAALLGAGAHHTNALADLDADAHTGVRGLPQALGARASLVVAGALFLAGTVVAGLGAAAVATETARVVAAGALALGGAGLAAGVLDGWRRPRRRSFTLTILGAAGVVAALVASGSVLVP